MDIIEAQLIEDQPEIDSLNEVVIEAVAVDSVAIDAELEDHNGFVQVELIDSSSWPFRIAAFVNWMVSRLFGIASAIFLLASAASVPIIQFISLGYLFEVTGRVGRSGRFRDGFVDLEKAAKIGGLVLGTSLCMLPIRLASQAWYHAWLIDSTSSQTAGARAVQLILIALLIPHILAAWFCGGRLRHFFWPLIAPFSIGLWGIRKLISVPGFKQTFDSATGWLAPNLADDIACVRPLTNWFLPAVLFKNIFSGKLLVNARDKVWDFLTSLRLPHYFLLGLKGFAGSFLWLFGPTMLLIFSTFVVANNRLSADQAVGISVLLAFAALLISSTMFAVLPAIQARYATTGKFRSFFEIGEAWRGVRGAPFLYWLAVFVMFLLALPLFLFDIEPVPRPLLWTIAIFFMILIWPGKILLGWAFGRGMNRAKPRPWWIAVPVSLSLIPVAFAYCFFLFFTRYTSWNGTWSLLENEVFLLPVPFWLAM